MIKLLQWGFEALIGLLILIVVYSQIIRPLVKKTPVFPIFRRRPKLEGELESVNEGLEDKAQQRELERKRRQLGN